MDKTKTLINIIHNLAKINKKGTINTLRREIKILEK